jgi:hypothetical protein
VSKSKLIADQFTCEEATHVIGKQVFSIATAASGETTDPNNLARAMRHVATELGSK